jgi:hypothetical protein
MGQRQGGETLGPNTPLVLNATYHSFELDDLDLTGQILVVIRDGKPTLAYRRTMSHRWSPEIMPNTPENKQSV